MTRDLDSTGEPEGGRVAPPAATYAEAQPVQKAAVPSAAVSKTAPMQSAAAPEQRAPQRATQETRQARGSAAPASQDRRRSAPRTPPVRPTAIAAARAEETARAAAVAAAELQAATSAATGAAASPAIAALTGADAEMQELARRALWLGGQGRDPLISFSSLFLAFLGGGTPISDWVKATAEDMKLEAQPILDHWEAVGRERGHGSYAPGVRVEHVRAPEAPPAQSYDITPSARAVIDAAVAYQTTTGAAALGARHVFAVYAFGPVGHARDFEAWRFQRRSWAARFAAALGAIAPEESEHWRPTSIAGWTGQPSPRWYQALAAAESLCRARGAAAVAVEDVVRGLLGCAVEWKDEERANVWLLGQLGADALTVLHVPAAGPQPSPGTGPSSRHDGLPRSPEVAAWLRDAQIWALCCPRDELQLRHVVAALVAPRGPAAGKRMLRKAGGDPRQLAAGLAQLIRAHEPVEDHATWRWLLDNDAAVRDSAKPGYASDIARGPDLLSLGGEVHALASVLASVDTSPPLSVGLFGNWGSGKSFFMEMLRDHIRTLAQRSCGAKSSYCSEIAQIEFNAWHYLDGDLWASLVSHVLESLESYFRGDAQSVADQARAELATNQLQAAEIEKQQRALAERRDRFEAGIRAYRPSGVEIAADLVGEVTEQVKQRTAEAHPEVRKALDEVAKQVGVAPSEIDLAAARSHTATIRAWWTQVTPRKVMIGLAVMAIAAVGAVVAAKADLAVVSAIAALAPVFALVARIVKIGGPIAKAAKQAVEIGEKVTDRIARSRPSAFREQAELDRDQGALDAAHARLQQRAQALVDQLAKAKPVGMREYVLDRAGQYRDRLGIVALVHRDFQNLSDQLRDQTTDPKLQRIILYIDDLDRCPPARVVEMLQAIHLLLSFELFVVVVAVDPTWLTRSLEAYYAQQFAGCPAPTGDREARPQFYLEKIFQIPYALQPMSGARFGHMVDGLLRTAVAPGSGAALGVAGAAGADAGAAAVAAASGDRGAAAAGPAHGADADASADDAFREAFEPPPAIDLMPRNLQITTAELMHLRTLGPLVSSPRATKRLTNLYRIVRAGLAGDELDDFIDDGYQLTQVLLAAVVGCPDVAAEWFQEVLGQPSGDTAGMLAPLDKLAAEGPQARFLLDRVRSCVTAAAAGGRALTRQRMMEACTLAARYSFETGALLDLVPR